jgi:hypothetical protein
MPARPGREQLAAPDVQGFRRMVEAALRAVHPDAPPGEPPISATKWGVYAFYDYEDEPIYVGQTNESLRVRIRRHLTNQRTDAVGMRVLDPYEIRWIEMWPLVEFGNGQKNLPVDEKRQHLNRLERTVYERAIRASRFGVILNEKIPPDVPLLADDELPLSYRFPVVPDEVLEERQHPDNRIARRAETLGRLANVIRERGSVSNGLRRVVVVQAVRLAWLGAVRLAEAEGRPVPDFHETVDLPALVAGALEPDEDDEDAEEADAD